MFTEYRQLRSELRRFAGTLGATVSTLALLAALPKDMRYGADSRFALVVGFGVIGIAGTWLSLRAARRLAEARLKLRHAGAGQQVEVALRFLLDERRLARKFLSPLLLLTIAAGFGTLVARWPQAEGLMRFHSVLVGAGVLGAVGLVVAPLMQRTHWINAAHLRSLLEQQMRLLKFTPVTMRIARQRLKTLEGPRAAKVGDTLIAGGFAWQWIDWTRGVLICGQPGAGKTSAVLNALLELIFLMFPGANGFSGLIQDVKGDYRGKLKTLCSTYGRDASFVTFDLQADPANAGSWEAAIFNPVGSDDPPAEIAASLHAASAHLGVVSQDSFFPDAFRTLNTHGIGLLRAALPDGEVPSIAGLQRLYMELHQAAEEEARSEAPAPRLYYDALCRSIRDQWPVPETLPTDVAEAVSYFETQFMTMASRQRSALIGTVSQLFTELLAEPVRSFTTGRSTVSMRDVVEQGILYYVHAPLAANPRLGLIISTLIKRQFQLAVRRAREKEIPSIYLCDEFHNLFSPGADGDSQFFSLSRDANHANFVAVQNLPLLMQVAKSKAQVMALLGNVATKILLRNTEPETNEYASGLFGESVGIGVTQSEVADVSGLFRRRRTTYSRGTTKGRVVPPSAFATLAVPVPGDPARHYAQSIVHLATRAETERLDLVWKIHPL